MYSLISVDPEICGGKPCVKGTRIPVNMVLELLEVDIGFDKIIENYYPSLTKEDLKACVNYAKELVEGEEIHLAMEMTK